MITTTLKDIRDNSPCTEGWETLLSHLGKFPTEAKSCTDELPVLTVLEANGMDDALWVLDNCINPHICRLFAADCAERVLHIFEKELPDDDRPRKAIEVARNPNVTDAAGADAGYAAGAAARAAAGYAARAAAWAAAGAAAGYAARSAAAGYAARSAARAAAGYAAWAAAGYAAGDDQEKRLRQYLEHGEAAKDMEWPE